MLNEVDPAANRSTANGSTTVFPYTWQITLKTDIEVLVDAVVKTVDVDYTVDGLGVSGGGNVTFFAAPANNSIVTRLRKQPASQLSVYTPNEGFPHQRVMADLDKLTMQIQQVKEQLHRGFFLPKSSNLSDQGVDVPVVGSFARGKVGGGIDWATVTSSGSLSLPVAITDGGTGATTAAGARTNLLVYSENTLIDAKGDLLVGASDNTLARLAPPATTGFVPTYDPAATNFISWGPRAQPNPIINGNMEIWQRGTTFTNPATATHSADRWIRNGPTGATVTRSTNVPTVAQAGVLFNYSYSIDVTVADLSGVNLHEIIQKIEGYNWRHFAQRNIIISFWIRSTKTGIYSLGVLNNGDRYYISEYTINTTNTWEYKTITIPASPSAGAWDYTNGIGLIVRFGLVKSTTSSGTVGAWTTGALSTSTNQVNAADTIGNIIRITGVKLELGSVASPIQFVPLEEELARAKRYYQKSFPYAVAPAQGAGLAGAFTVPSTGVGAVSIVLGTVLFTTPLRTNTPTITLYNPISANAEARNMSDAADCSGTIATLTTESSMALSATANAGSAVGEQISVQWSVNAEP